MRNCMEELLPGNREPPTNPSGIVIGEAGLTSRSVKRCRRIRRWRENRQVRERITMLGSKASAALERLKEFDKKYKLRGERKKKSESSEEADWTRVSSAGSNQLEPKELTVVPLKSKLDIRIPDGHVDSGKESATRRSLTSELATPGAKTSSTSSNSSRTQQIGNVRRKSELEESPRISSIGSSDSSQVEEIVNGKSENSVRVSRRARSSSTSSSLDSSQAEANRDVRIRSESEISTHEDEASTSITASSSEENNSRTYRSDTFEEPSSSGKSPGTSSRGKLVDVGEVKRVIELVSPKPVESASQCELGLDEELSDYVKMMEALEVDSVEIKPIALLKSNVKQAEAESGKRAKPVDRKAKSSLEELYDPEKSIESQSNQGSIIDAPKEKAEELATKLESTDLLEEHAEEDANATRVLRQLNREAINAIIKRQRIAENSPRKASNIEEENSRRAKSKRRHSRTKRPMTNPRRDEKLKAEVSDSKESIGEHRRLIDQRLQKERDDLSAFRQELDKIHLLSGSRPIPRAPLIRPLELPNIQSYRRSEEDSPILRPITDIERLAEKLGEIQYWLKDQYTLYREYSKLAQIVNARYVPSNLQDAKQTIRELKTRTTVPNHRQTQPPTE